MHGLVSHLHERRAGIGIGIDRDGLDTHAPRGLDDPASNFAAVGDEDFLEHSSSLSFASQSIRLPGAAAMLSAIMRTADEQEGATASQLLDCDRLRISRVIGRAHRPLTSRAPLASSCKASRDSSPMPVVRIGARSIIFGDCQIIAATTLVSRLGNAAPRWAWRIQSPHRASKRGPHWPAPLRPSKRSSAPLRGDAKENCSWIYSPDPSSGGILWPSRRSISAAHSTTLLPGP